MKEPLQACFGRGKYFLFGLFFFLFSLNPSLADLLDGNSREEVVEKEKFSGPATPEKTAMVDVTVSGTVVDNQGEPIPGVTVSVPGTALGTATDLDGQYTLSVPEGATLVFSFLGLKRKKLKLVTGV